MAHIEMDIVDGGTAKDTAAPIMQKERFPFIVKSEAGLTKNGAHYKPGETVMLDAETGARFRAAGDVQ